MAIMLKNLQKSLSNLRSGSSSILNYLLGKEKLLLKRIHDNGIPYFSVLSPPNFSSTKHNYHLPHFEEFKVVAGSCNGIVCLDNTLDSNLLWNPSTGESRVILSRRRLSGMSPLSYNKHSFSCGFGYDSNSKHFKFIRFFYSFEQDDDGDEYTLEKQEIELYDLNRDTWRFLRHPGPAGYFVFRNPSIYINGFHYWFAYDKETPIILSFDFETELFREHDLPDGVNSKGSSLCFDFVDFQGEFGVIVFPKSGSEKSFELWISNGYNWIKEYEFCVAGAQRPLGFWDDGRFMFFESMDGQLMVCDINSGKMTIKLDTCDSSGKMQLFPYVESDVSIKGLLGTSKDNMEQRRGNRKATVVKKFVREA